MKLKIAHTADWHISPATLGKGLAFIEYFFRVCKEHEVNAIMHAGDVYDKTVTVGDGAFNELVKILRTTPAPLYVPHGTPQHDRPGSLSVFSWIDSEHGFPIYTFREPSSYALSLDTDRYHIPVLLPGAHAGSAWLSVLPTPTRAWLAAKYDVSYKELGEKYQEFITDILRGFGAQTEIKPHILLSHIEVRGSEASTGQILASNEAISVGSILEAKPTVTMLGHIHKAQQPSLEAHHIYYSGSPYPLNLGEMEKKGFRIYTFEDGDLIDMNFIETPLSIARPIQVIRIELNDGEFIWDAEPIDGVDLRIKVYAPRDWFTTEFFCEIEKRCAGANSLRIDKFPQPENRIRAANLPKMQTLTDELREWGQVKDVEVKPTVLEKLEKIEKGVAA